MKPTYFHTTFLFFLLINIAHLNAQSPSGNLDSVFRQINKSGKVDSMKWGFCLLDTNGIVYAKYNADKKLTPASIVKTLTTSIALETLSPNFHFQTKLAYTGNIDSQGQLWGDIIINSSADPTFASERFDAYYLKLVDRWVERIKSLGIKHIQGNIIIDKSICPNHNACEHWNEEDIGNYYGAAPSSLMFNENSYRVQFNKGKKGDTAIIKYIEPMPYGCRIENDVVYGRAKSGDNVIIFSHPNDTVICLFGTVPEQVDNFSIKGSLPNPELTFAQIVKDVLIKSGVGVKGIILKQENTPNQNRLTVILDSIRSPYLSRIVQETNVYSINLFAESILYQLGYHLYGEASAKSGLRKVKIELAHAGVDTSALTLYDGNGLSRRNAMSTAQFARFMHYAKHYSTSKQFVQSLPIGGISGGMKNILTTANYKGRIYAKTGYMGKVRSFTGYVDSQTKGRLSFCLIFNEYNCSNAEIKMLAEVLFKSLIDL